MTDSIQSPLKVMQNPFNFSDTQIRTAFDDYGEAWFCAKDVFEALNITWRASNSIKKVPEKWRMVTYLRTSNGIKETIFISEPAVYYIAFRSNKPEAIRFTEWVCEEVLPAIRRQGFYGHVTAGQQIQLRNQMIKMLELIQGPDAFVYTTLLDSLRDVCNQLGQKMPDSTLLGKFKGQLGMGV